MLAIYRVEGEREREREEVKPLFVRVGGRERRKEREKKNLEEFEQPMEIRAHINWRQVERHLNSKTRAR